MARPKSFDVTDVLRRAMSLFWSQGYEATSMRDLETHLGIGRQSLYDTFGDKHALFLEALRRYSADRESSRAELGRGDAGLAEILAWFDSLVLFAAPAGPRRACLIINTVAELGVQDAEASSICRKSRERLTRQFSRALENAASRGEIPRPSSITAAADFLVSQSYGIVLLAKNGASRARLRAATAQALRAIT